MSKKEESLQWEAIGQINCEFCDFTIRWGSRYKRDKQEAVTEANNHFCPVTS